jgi:hypothetical protein
LRIEPASGKLTHINTVPGGADPAHMSTDKAGKFLLTVYYVAGKVTVHTIGADGALSKEPRQTVKTKEKAHAIVLDPSECAALVPHTGPNVIYALPWDAETGELGKAGEWVFRLHRSDFATPKDTGRWRSSSGGTGSDRARAWSGAGYLCVASAPPHGVLDIPVVNLGPVLRTLTADDDLLGEMLEGRP